MRDIIRLILLTAFAPSYAKMMTYDWDSLERRLHRLTCIVQLAKKAEAKLISRRQTGDARNTYRAEADSEPDPDFKFEHLIDLDEIDPDKIDPKGLHGFLQYILNAVKSIQDTVEQLDSNNGSASEAEQDSASDSASEGQAEQDEGQAEQGQAEQHSDDPNYGNSSATEELLPGAGGNDGQQRTSQLRRSQRTHDAPKVTGTAVETTTTTSALGRHRKKHRANNTNLPQEDQINPEASPAPSQLQTSPGLMQLMQHQMRGKFVQTLQKRHRKQRQPYAIYDIVNLESLKLEQYYIDSEHLLRHDYKRIPTGLCITHKPTSGVRVDPSHFTWQGSIPTQEDMKKMFNNLRQNPPKSGGPYYIGLVEPAKELLGLGFEPLVHAGHRLRRRNDGNLPGINTVYVYISLGEYTPSVLHIEDAKLGSVNLVHLCINAFFGKCVS
ncbi:hypothetical protein K469DRAFT_713701, partial [Zopfia rhizophila CBS 207.26]